MATSRYKVGILLGVSIATAAVFCVVAFISVSPTYYHWQQERMVKRVLTAEPRDLLSAGRVLIQSRQGFIGEIDPSSHEIPIAIRKLTPTRVTFSKRGIIVDFSDLANPFGIVVFKAGVVPPTNWTSGPYPLQWIDGLWLYDDGQLGKYPQHSKHLKRSMPIRPISTNSTSSSATPTSSSLLPHFS
jgi:hypothetical protein